MTEGQGADALLITEKDTLVKGHVDFFPDQTALITVDCEAHPHLKDNVIGVKQILVKLTPKELTKAQLN